MQIVFRDNEITENRNKGKTMKEQKTSTKRNLFLSDLDQSKLQREVEKVMKELTKALIDPLEEARKRLERAQQALNQQMARMQAELAKQTADPHYQIPLGVYLDYGNAKNEYAVAEKELKRLERERVKSHGEMVEELKAQYLALKAAEEAARKGSEDEWRAAKANLDKARRALNKEGVSTLTIDHGPLTIDHSPLTIDHSREGRRAVAAKKSEEKRIRDEERIAEKIARLRMTMEADEIKSMEDSTERKVRQMEHDRRQRLQSIEQTHAELLRLRGGSLTEGEEAVFAEAREQAFMQESKRLDALLRERLTSAAHAEQEYLRRYGTWEERRQAIRQLYEEKMTKSESEGARKSLTREMDAALSKVDMDELKWSIDWDDVFSDISRHSKVYLETLRQRLQDALDAKGITEENARVLMEKIETISDEINSRGNLWETLLPTMGLRKRLERELKEAEEEISSGGGRDTSRPYGENARNAKIESIKDQLGSLGGWKDVFGWLNGSPLEVIDGLNANIQSMGDLVDTLGLGKSGVGQAIHDFAAGSASFTGALKSLAGGDAVGALNGVLKGFQSWGKVIGIGNGSNAKEVARVTERNTESNERLTHAVERLKETMDREHGASAVSTYEMALADQQRIIAQQMEILKAQMSYHGAHHSNAKNFDLGDEAYARISSLVGREVNSLDSLYDLTPEEMDDIRTKLTDVWASILSQGDYDKSEYWERYADLAGTVESLTEQISENLTQTSFESLRDDFVSTLMDMGSDASDFSGRFSEMMQRSLLNMAIGNTIDKELESWYTSWAERLQSGTLTPAEIARYKSEYDALVARGLAQRDQIAQLTGYSGGESESESTRGTFKSMSQATGEALEGRFTAIQIQATRLAEIVQKQSEDVARIAATGNGTYTLVGEMNDVVWQCSQYLETIARNTGYMPSIDRNIAQMRLKIDKL